MAIVIVDHPPLHFGCPVFNDEFAALVHQVSVHSNDWFSFIKNNDEMHYT
jgi:hypothetical protein